MRKQIIRLISMMTLLALMLAIVPALADGNDGWVSISIGEQEGVKIELFLIATGETGDWTMENGFSDITIPTGNDSASTIEKDTNQAWQRIQDRKTKPIQSGTSDRSGKVEFRNLPHGVFIAMVPEEVENLQIRPSMLFIPDNEGSVQVRARIKFEIITPEPTTPAPTTPRPTLTPFVPDEPTPTLTPPISPTPGDETPTPEPSRTPAPATRQPVATPEPEPNPEQTPIPKHAKQLKPKANETVVHLEDYETALGLGNIQMHVGVCFD